MLKELGARFRARRWNRARGWEFSGSVTEGEVLAEWPCDLWAADWIATGVSAELRDPLRAERRMVPTYYVMAGERRFAFAATEFSNGLWGFYLPV